MEKNSMVTYMGPVEYSIEIALERIESVLQKTYNLSKRAVGILLLKDDGEIKELVKEREPEAITQIEKIINEVKVHYSHPVDYEIALKQNEEAARISDRVFKSGAERTGFAGRLSALMMNPVTGLPILFVVLYWGLYKFVGDFGAGTVVDFIEGKIFEEHINPYMISFVNGIVPWIPIQASCR
jgi:ferrous iron transport protein B